MTRRFGDRNKTNISRFVTVLMVAFVTHGSVAQTPPVFQPMVLYASGGALTYSIAVADVNGDGHPDLLVANCAVPASICDGSLRVLLGNGDGTFNSPVVYSSGGLESFSLAVADVNKDGRLDVVMTNVCADISCNGGSIGVLLGNGDGTFQPAITYDAGALEAVSVAISDVNGDGNPDVVVAVCGTSSCSQNGSRNGKVNILLGNGDGTFQPALRNDSGGTIAVSVAIADVNRDGKPDILVANCAAIGAESCGDTNSDGVLGVLLGNGDGTFQPASAYDTGGSFARSLAVADLNGDGIPDAVLAHCGSNQGCGSGGTIGVLLGNGDGTFQPAVTYNSGGGDTTAAVIGDLNGDGNPDIVADFAPYLAILLGNGDGTFQSALTLDAGANPFALAVADVNGDGKPDLFVAQGGGVVPNFIGVLLNATPFDTTPPAITVSATPRTLWPANGRMVPVTLSGTITDAGSGVNASSATYAVEDEYGVIKPSGTISLGPGGTYSFVILLQASRRGSDLDGRRYTATVQAKDNAGNVALKSAAVIVPHDQRK